MAELIPEIRVERIDFGPPGTPVPVSIVIPTRDRGRGGLLDRLLEDLAGQSLPRFEVVLVIGDPRQGRAINRGAREARGRILVTMDDDTGIEGRALLENLVALLDGNPDVGIAGASTVVPPEASWFQRLASRQIPRRLFPVQKEIRDSDMAQHPCLAIRRDLFFAIGGEDEELIRGLDPLLRHKVRRAGKRVVIAPDTAISHPLPEGLPALLRMYFRNGRGSGFAQRRFPERIFNLDSGARGDRFPVQIPLIRRVARYPVRLLHSLITLRWIRLGVELAYMTGWLWEFVAVRARARITSASGPQIRVRFGRDD
ncbi:MAG: glycosyltransferase [Planctomycetota bacterium]